MPDSPEIVEFRPLFARIKMQCDDDPARLRELAGTDASVPPLSLSILKVAGAIQRSEQSGRDLFTGPVDPDFIREWRDFEERFAALLLDIRSATAAAQDRLFSFEYYEEPEHWAVADFKAMKSALSLDAAIMFATSQAEHAGEDGAGITWQEINVNAMPEEVRRAYMNLANAESEAQDKYEAWRDELYDQVVLSSDARKRSEYVALLSKILEERSRVGGISVEDVAKGAFEFWETLKARSGLDIRAVLRRRALIPFVLFPRHVSARLSNTALPSIYRNLRQAHDAFVYGVPFAALALMRSVMEMILREHYDAKGGNLEALINDVGTRLPERANAAALIRLKNFANEVLHGRHRMGTAPLPIAERREFEQEIVSLLFVLRALVEGAPNLRGSSS